MVEGNTTPHALAISWTANDPDDGRLPGILRRGALQRLLKRIAAAQGLTILTDSDAAGFKIRHFVTGLVGAGMSCRPTSRRLRGKESRKAEPGKEGLLGVEGVSDDLIVQGLETAPGK